MKGWDYSYVHVYSKGEIYKLTCTKPLKNYIKQQKLLWIGHCTCTCRYICMESNASQKIMLFAILDRPYLWELWKKLGNE